MESIKPIDKMAVRFNLSRESAKYYIGRVQKAFKTEKPSHKVIMDFIDGQDVESLPQAQKLAFLMKEVGLWPYELTTEPPLDSIEGGDYPGGKGRGINRKTRPARENNFGQEKHNLCPHGLPRNKICADCEFESFKKLTESE
jgi:hypothetical protein